MKVSFLHKCLQFEGGRMVEVEWIGEEEFEAMERAMTSALSERHLGSSSSLPHPKAVENRSIPWSFDHSFFPGRVAKPKLPFLQFKGHIIYSNTSVDAHKAASELQRLVDAKKAAFGGSIPLGFDIEWKAVFQRGVPPRKAALLQLCVDSDQCFLFHVIHSGIPENLQSLLTDSTTYKVGIQSHQDAAKLRRDYGVAVKEVIDLCTVAHQKLGGSYKKSWTLSGLAENLICKQLDKNGSVRTGDWEQSSLSAAQLNYAATDAFASLHLYQVLIALSS